MNVYNFAFEIPKSQGQGTVCGQEQSLPPPSLPPSLPEYLRYNIGQNGKTSVVILPECPFVVQYMTLMRLD